VFAGILGSKDLFAVTCLVVLLSVVIHGGGIALYLRRRTDRTARVQQTEGRAAPSPISRREHLPLIDQGDQGTDETPLPEKITLDEVRRLITAGAPMELLDVRTERSYRDDNLTATGAIRMPPDDAVRIAREIGLSHHASLVLYCA
jgi:NhaP-type Na+/H+ or K+/H+ antiporter